MFALPAIAAAPAFYGGVAGGVGSIVGNIMAGRQTSSANEANMQRMLASTYFDNMAQDKAMAYNTTEQQYARNFNAEEALKARQFSADQEVIARQFNSAEAAAGRAFGAEQADLSRQFNAGAMNAQMNFQERMRATQYQTAMADMRAAGLNPMLAYAQGGAGTPIGSALGSSAASAQIASSRGASGPAASSGAATAPGASPGNTIAAMRRPTPDLGAVLASAMGAAQIENVQAQTRKTDAETENVKAEQIGPDGPKTYSVMEKANRATFLATQTAHELEKQDLTRSQNDLVQEEIKNAVEENRWIRARTGNTQVDTVLKSLHQAEMKAGSDYWKEHPGTYGVMQGLKMFGHGVNSASDIVDMIRPRFFKR